MSRLIARLARVAVLIAVPLALAGCGINTIPTKDERAKAAWAEVRAALTPPQQALAVRRFMAALANANGRPVVPPMDAREIASGRAAAADDPACCKGPRPMRRP